MNAFEKGLLSYMSLETLRMLQEYKIGIGGAGGLGSNCAVNLVRTGFSKFVIADFDKVEAGNLNRQFYFIDQLGLKKVNALRDNLLKINPDVMIETYDCIVNKENISEIFYDCSIIVEAFDKAICKQMMVEEFMNTDKFLVAASGLAGWKDSDRIKTRRINNNFYLIGDMETEVSQDMPPLSPCVNIAAAKEANAIVAYVMDRVKYRKVEE